MELLQEQYFAGLFTLATCISNVEAGTNLRSDFVLD